MLLGKRSGLAVRIGACIQRMKQLHRRNIIDVNLEFEHDDQSFPIHPHGEDSGREEEFTYRGLSLLERTISTSALRVERKARACLCVYDL